MKQNNNSNNNFIVQWLLITVIIPGMLMRPEYHEAKAEARKCEAKDEAKAEAKKILRGRGQHLWGRGRRHEATHYNASTFYNKKFMFMNI